MSEQRLHRFWLFSGECYYARGGMNDWVAAAATIDELVVLAEQIGDTWIKGALAKYEWWHIVDSTSGEVVNRSDATPYGDTRDE